MKKLATLCALLLLSVLAHAQSSCGTPNSWCQVWPNPNIQVAPGTPFFSDPGWNRLFYAPDTQRFYTTGIGNVTTGTGDAATPVMGPDNNAFFLIDPSKFIASGQPKQADATTGTPYIELANEGAVAAPWLPAVRNQRYYSQNAVGVTDASINVCMGSPTSNCTSATGSSGQLFTSSGYMSVGDEMVYYDTCSANNSDTNCTHTGWTVATIHIPSTCIAGNGKPGQGTALCRGLKQSVGYVAATTHGAGEIIYVTAQTAAGPTTGIIFGPRFNEGGTNPPTFHMAYDASGNELDVPLDRHWGGGTAYDSKRGRIWAAWGWEDNWNPNDLWYLPIAVKAGYTTSSDIAGGFRRVPLLTNGGAINPTVGSTGIAENDQIYIPDPYDVLFEFGGMNMSGGLNWAYIYCLSNTSWGTGGIPATGPFGCNGQINKWQPIYNYANNNWTTTYGDPGARDGGRMIWDSVHEKVLIFGGRNSQRGTAVNWVSVAQWDPKTGKYCLSDVAQNATGSNPVGYESSAPGCSLPAMSGTGPSAPSLGLQSPYFPLWTWDSTRSLAVAYLGPGQLYTYDPGLNKWALTSVAGGPTNTIGSKSLAYDSTHDMYLATTYGGKDLWMLPGAAVSGSAPVSYNLTVSVNGTGTGAVLDSPQANINCPGQCSHAYSSGTQVSLVVQPSGGSSFAGWAGACSGTGTCTFSMDADKTVTATFNPPPAPSSTMFSGMTLGGMVIQ